MRLSQLFSQTLREAPAEAQVASHQLLLRAGFIRQSAAGIFAYLPMAMRSIHKIQAILRAEMNAIGGQEVLMPVVLPASIWQETKRWYRIGAEMTRLQDRNQRDLVLAMTHEEAVGDLVRREIHSYRQLPQLIYHLQTKWRDDPRPRAGLIRVREFTMKDSYSLDADWDGLDQQYQAHYHAYFRIFERCGLPVIAVQSDTGMMGGSLAHEYMYLTPIGEDTLMLCDSCGNAANRQVARFQKAAPPTEPAQPLEPVATPETKTIADLAALLQIPAERTAKAVFFVATFADKPAELVFAVLRGEMEVNETKLANAVGASELRPATEEEIRAVGAQPGYASPVGLAANAALIVVDDLIPLAPNLVAGANREGYHLRNVNYGRDYTAHIVADIAAAQDGSPCPNCGAPLRAVRGVEVGNIFKLGTFYSEALGCYFLDANGEKKPVVMGSYGIGVGRLLACIAEEHHDEAGLCLPKSVAPFDVHLVTLTGRGAEAESVQQAAETVYAALQAAGIETLLDDREESPGVKFADADLIGLPLRLTVSARSLKSGGVECKPRRSSARSILPLEGLVEAVKEILHTLP
ncbi:MAG: proline--tRNA ligase [Anaerolineales bacterium]